MAGTARRDARIDLVVRSRDGSPLEGYLAEVFAPPGGSAPPPQRTDAKGAARFGDLAALNGYAVRVSDRGGVAGHAFVQHRTADLGSLPVANLKFTVADSRIVGSVVDAESRQAVPGAAVRAIEMDVHGEEEVFHMSAYSIGRSSPERVVASATSDAEGRFVLAGTWRFVDVAASLPDGRQGSTVSGDPPWPGAESLIVEVARPRLSVMRGVVVDDRGRPVVGAQVSIVTRGSKADAPISATTDGEGRFATEAIEPGYLHLDIRPKEGPAAEGEAWVAEGQPMRIVVPVTSALALRVTDEMTGLPVSGVTVEVLHNPVSAAEAFPAEAQGPATDAEGKARIPMSPGTASFFRVRAPGYRESWLNPPEFESGAVLVASGSDLASPLAAGEVREVGLRLRRGVVVTGRVVFEDGRPAARVRVGTDEQFSMGGRAATTTGEDGRFRMENVLPPRPSGFDSPVRVAASLEGYALAAATPREATKPGATGSEDVGDLVLLRIGSLRGRVLGSNGKPVPGARVFVEGAPAGEGSSADGEGWFVVGVGARMPMAREVALAVSAGGFQATRVSLTDLPPPGGVRDLEPVTLLSAVALRLRVLDEKGSPLLGVRVLARNSFRGSELMAAPRTGADGRVALDTVDLDASFTVLTEDGRKFSLWAWGREPRATAEVVVRLPPTRRLEGRVVDGAGGPVGFARLVLDTHDSHREEVANVDPFLRGTGADGVFKEPAVPAGAFQLEVTATGFVTRLVDVPAGAPPPLEIVLERFGAAHRKRLAELQEEIRALKAEIARDASSQWDARESHLYELEREAQRLSGH